MFGLFFSNICIRVFIFLKLYFNSVPFIKYFKQDVFFKNNEAFLLRERFFSPNDRVFAYSDRDSYTHYFLNNVFGLLLSSRFKDCMIFSFTGLLNKFLSFFYFFNKLNILMFSLFSFKNIRFLRNLFFFLKKNNKLIIIIDNYSLKPVISLIYATNINFLMTLWFIKNNSTFIIFFLNKICYLYSLQLMIKI